LKTITTTKDFDLIVLMMSVRNDDLWNVCINCPVHSKFDNLYCILFKLKLFVLCKFELSILPYALFDKKYCLTKCCAGSSSTKRKLYSLPDPPHSAVQPLAMALHGKKRHHSVSGKATKQQTNQFNQIEATESGMSEEENQCVMLSVNPATPSGMQARHSPVENPSAMLSVNPATPSGMQARHSPVENPSAMLSVNPATPAGIQTCHSPVAVNDLSLEQKPSGMLSTNQPSTPAGIQIHHCPVEVNDMSVEQNPSAMVSVNVGLPTTPTGIQSGHGPVPEDDWSVGQNIDTLQRKRLTQFTSNYCQLVSEKLDMLIQTVGELQQSFQQHISLCRSSSAREELELEDFNMPISSHDQMMNLEDSLKDKTKRSNLVCTFLCIAN
jgi:hypothetical protein